MRSDDTIERCAAQVTPNGRAIASRARRKMYGFAVRLMLKMSQLSAYPVNKDVLAEVVKVVTIVGARSKYKCHKKVNTDENKAAMPSVHLCDWSFV